jgi:hypothetical protein
VVNLSNDDLVVHRGKRVAEFHRQDQDYYVTVPVDLETPAADSAGTERNEDEPPAHGDDEDSLEQPMCAAQAAHEDIRPPEEVAKEYDKRTHLKAITIGDKNSQLTKEMVARVKELILKHEPLWNDSSAKTSKATGAVCHIQPQSGANPNFHAGRGAANPEARQEMAKQVKTLSTNTSKPWTQCSNASPHTAYH